MIVFSNTGQLSVLLLLSVALLSTFADVCTPDRKWVAYSKLYQSLEVDSSVLFQQLTSIEYHWHQQELPYQQVGYERLTQCNLHMCLIYNTHEFLSVDSS